MEKKAKQIAWDMYNRGLYPWHVSGYVKKKALPITQTEENQLIELVKKQLQKLVR